MPKGITDEKSALVQVMAWCRQATSHFLSQCWLRFISPFGITRLEWVNQVWKLILVSSVKYATCLHPSILWGHMIPTGDWPTIDQSHRYGRHQAACREPAGSYDKTTRTAICFEHKTQYLLIRAPYTCIVVFWYISNIPPMISQSQISCNTPTLYIAAIFVKYCYTTGSWLLLLMS